MRRVEPQPQPGAGREVCGASSRAGRKQLVLREGAVRKEDKPILQGTRWSQAILPLKNQTGMGIVPEGAPVVCAGRGGAGTEGVG